MKLFLTLHLLEDRFSFTPNLIALDEARSFDMDNFSDDLVTGAALKAIGEAEKIVVWINARAHNSPGAILKVLNLLARRKKSLLFIHNGGHPVVKKMSNIFDQNAVFTDQSTDEIKNRAIDFFSSPA